MRPTPRAMGVLCAVALVPFLLNVFMTKYAEVRWISAAGVLIALAGLVFAWWIARHPRR